MPFSPVQTYSPGIQPVAAGGATPAIAMPNPVAAGDTVFLFFGGGNNAGISGVTDSQGNTWQQAGLAGDSGTDRAAVSIWYATNVSAGALTVHPAITNPNSVPIDYVVVLVEGLGIFTFDVSSSSALGGGSGVDSAGGSENANVTTTHDGDVLLAMWFQISPVTQPATCSWPVYLSGNDDWPTGGRGGGFMVAATQAGAAGGYTATTNHADLTSGQPSGFGEAGAAGWGASLVVVAGQLVVAPPPPVIIVDDCGISHSVPATDGIVIDLCKRAGLEPWQIDVSQLTAANLGSATANIVPGYVITRPTAAREILRPLMEGYFFGGRESSGAMQWIPLGLAPAMAIPEGDLGLKGDLAKLIAEQIGQEGDLPRFCTVTFDDPTLNYQQNKQFKQRNSRIVSTNQHKILELPLTQLADWAMQTATKSLYLAWLERFSYKMNLWRAIYALLDPMDVITFTYEGLTFRIRVAESSVGAGLAISISGPNEYAELLTSGATGGQGLGFPGSTLQALGPSTLWIFDIPLLRDIDSNFPNTGFYFALSSTLRTWGGGSLFSSTDDSNFSAVTGSSNPATFGVATNTLAAPPRSPWTWDRTSTLTVALQRGAFASDTALNVLNGSNYVIVGSELIQFQTAVQNPDGTWTLSNLLRGRRGTEWACSSHVASELVLLVASGLVRVPQPLAIVGQDRWYKGVTIGEDPATVTAVDVPLTGADLKPYAPCHITGSRDISGNLTINWIRRTRVGWLNLAQDPVPLSEDSEKYQLDVYNGLTLVRSITGLTSPTAGYSAAQQTTDFGSTQASVSLKLYQLSGEVGKGFAGVASV